MKSPDAQSTANKILELLRKVKPSDASNPAIRELFKVEGVEELYGQLEFGQAGKDPERHESRMRLSIQNAAASMNLGWDERCPPDHPFGAMLDGSLWQGKKRIAVVELEAKNRKQIDGSLLDLLTHPETKKVLVIGRSKLGPAYAVKAKIVNEVLPAIQSLLKTPAEIGVFSETELNFRPDNFRKFLGV